MPEIDEFARSLLEEAKRFLERASEAEDAHEAEAYLHSALMLAFCALEAHVNAVAEEVATRSEVSMHERGFLLEREVRLEHGEFVLRNKLKMTSIEERIHFLHVKFGHPLDHSKPHWSRLADALILRNRLTHPKDVIEITEEEVGRAILAIIETIDALYQAIYNKAFPATSRGLQSTLSF
jgi:hypothetical protein